MQHNKVTLLVAPALQNSSCTHARYNHVTIYTGLTPWHLLQAIIVSSLTTGVLVANMLLIFVINSKRYAKYIHSQPRYLLTSLASNHIAMGLLVTPFAIVPSLRNCWPYGELACQIQALLRGAISHQSAVILICMALDRYLCMLHPARYHKHSSKKGCVAVISITWIISITIFSILVLPRGGFYFNSTGMIACEPFYSRPSIRILTACGFYFPTTMILMYCYGSAFHVNKLRLLTSGCNTIATPTPQNIRKTSVEKLVIKERRLSTTASRTMAAMSLGFIVLVTPWTIQEVVAACTGSRAPAPLDFLATWLALSNSFWNPFLYWLLNNHFRRISRELLLNILFCRRQSTSSNKQQYHSNSSSGTLGVAPTFDLECLSEKYWGEILEHTLSSNSSLHTLQRSHGNNGSRNNQNRSMPCYYNGLQHHEMKVLDTAVPDSSIQKSINPYPT